MGVSVGGPEFSHMTRLYFRLKILFRLYQLEVELIDVQDEMVKTKYWLNTNRKRYNDNADKKQTKKRR